MLIRKPFALTDDRIGKTNERVSKQAYETVGSKP